MSTITVVVITAMAITVVATTVVTMVIPGGATLMLMLIPILILMLIIILILILTFILILSPSASAGAGVFGKGVAIVAATAQFDRAGTSRHGFGASGAAGAAICLSFALSASESPRAPAQCASSRKAAASFGTSGLLSPKGE